MKSSSVGNFLLWLSGALWCATVVMGFVGLAAYANCAGEPGERGSHWPAETAIPFDRGRPNLLLFLHPRCPCSRATLAELEKILASQQKSVAIHVLMFRPEGAADSWTRTGLWDQAQALPDVHVWTDVGAIEAKRFGAATSGLVLVYNASAKLVFQGGITPSRGHVGDNAGGTVVSSLIAGSTSSQFCSPVFGCPLFRDARNRHEKRLP
jgi:hypothetical protein